MPTKKAKKRQPRLPKELIVIKNPDKLYHEKWSPNRDMLNIPHPFRAVVFGPPNSGKTLIVKNILIRAKPEYERVCVIHCDPGFTQEYEDCDAEMLDEIPSPEEWDGEMKTLCVLDDLEYKQMSSNQKRNLDRLFGFVSTHKNVSVILCAQDGFGVPAACRRCANMWILWRSPDLDAMSTVARRTGMKSKDFKAIFDGLMQKKTDSLWIDMTSKSPYPLRRNGFDIIKKRMASIGTEVPEVLPSKKKNSKLNKTYESI